MVSKMLEYFVVFGYLFPVPFCRLYPHVSCFTFHFLSFPLPVSLLCSHFPHAVRLLLLVFLYLLLMFPGLVCFAVLPESLEFHRGLYFFQVMCFSLFFWIFPRLYSVLSSALFAAWILIFGQQLALLRLFVCSSICLSLCLHWVFHFQAITLVGRQP